MNTSDSCALRQPAPLSRLLCLAAAGLLLAACGGSDGGDDGAAGNTHEFDGVWTGTLLAEVLPPMPPDTELQFQQLIYGDRVMQRYPPSYSLITDGHQRVVNTRQEDGKRVAEVTGKVRNYLEKNYLVETSFRSFFVAQDHFSSSVSDAGYSATLTGDYLRMTEPPVPISALAGNWASNRGDSSGSISIDTAGNFTGEIDLGGEVGSCQIEGGEIRELKAGLHLYSIRFTRRCAGHDMAPHAFDGLMTAVRDTTMGSIAAIVTHPQFAMGLDFTPTFSP